MEELVTLTQAQIARVFERWNRDCGADKRPLQRPELVDHEAQAAEFVRYANELIAAEH